LVRYYQRRPRKQAAGFAPQPLACSRAAPFFEKETGYALSRIKRLLFAITIFSSPRLRRRTEKAGTTDPDAGSRDQWITPVAEVAVQVAQARKRIFR